jgi:hypothetical protein
VPDMNDDECALATEVEKLECRLRRAQADVARLRASAVRSRRLEKVLSAVIVTGTLVASFAAAPLSQRVRAPFRVVDAHNHLLFKVNPDPRGFGLIAESGVNTVGASALDNASFIKVSAPGGAPNVVMAVTDDKTPLLALRYGGATTTRVALAVVDDKPELNLTNDNNINVLELGQGAYGGGHLQLGGADGNSRVVAGMVAAGIGAWQTFPDGNPGRGLFGLPGTFLCGLGCPYAGPQ